MIDIYATVAAIVGTEIPAGSAEDSYNQLALLEGIAPANATRWFTTQTRRATPSVKAIGC